VGVFDTDAILFVGHFGGGLCIEEEGSGLIVRVTV
jgi:hypothetical protein